MATSGPIVRSSTNYQQFHNFSVVRSPHSLDCAPMPRLFHLPISPSSRIVRLVLAEKRREADLVEERVWERRPDFLAMNPACEVPVLVDDTDGVIAGSTPIAEYCEERWPEPPLLAGDARARAEVRRLVDWFDRKFATEVSDPLVFEKVTKRFLRIDEGGGAPDMAIVRVALHNLRYHLDYICYLMETHNWLGGAEMSLADLTAAAHLSCLDYVGDVPWGQYVGAKEWYVRLKSRPSFRGLLADHIPGMPPPRRYADLDF